MEVGLPNRVRFGAFAFDLKAGELRKGARKVLLQEQPFQILLMLVERRGDVVSCDEIKKRLWPNDTVVEFDHSIHTAIKKLRQALDDSADNPKYVETVARRGYRLMVPVESESDSSSDPANEGAPSLSLEARGPDVSSRLIGKKVSHYRVLEVVGGGGMGLVYKAEDLKLGRRVALKFLPEELASDAIALQRFEREARTASSLNHSNICTIHEVEEHEGQPFIVMELLEGETLRERLSACDRGLALDELLGIALQVAAGLEAAHEQGIIHRDIKPANIFLTRKGTAKILDFGLAKLMVEAPESVRVERTFRPASQPSLLSQGGIQPGAGLNPASNDKSDALNGTPEGVPLQIHGPADHSLTRTGSAMGTAGYMSPEQIRGEKLDARTDLFSFGLVLYEIATGQRAFTGNTAAILKDAILNNTPAPIRALDSAVPPDLERVIDKALQKDRERRFQSAAEMRAELRVLNHELVVPAAPPIRWKLLAAAVVVLGVLIVGGYLWRRTHVGSKLAASDTVVLADFTNHTSDPAFGDALRAALEIDFGQTPFLNILSAEKIRGTLKLMGRPENDKLTPELAREVCLRTNSKVLLQGSISDVGNQYELEVKSVDCRNADTVARSRATAGERNEIVKRLGEAGSSLREKLGEPSSSLRQFNAPLDTAASPSVEALAAYAAGLANYGKVEAVSHFKRAAQLDPNFALPYVSLARAYNNLDDYNHEFESLTKAYQLRERVSLRDRLDLEAFYYADVTGEWEKALSTAQQAIQNFPLWAKPRNFLAYLWRLVGDDEKAAAAARDAMRLMPDNMSPYANLSISYMALNRVDDAKLVLDRAKARAPDCWNFHWTAYRLAFLGNDHDGMQEEVRWAAGQPGIEHFFLWERSRTEAHYGRLRKADEFSKQAALAAQAGASGRTTDRKASQALMAAKVGEVSRAQELAQDVMSRNPSPRAKHMAGLAFAKAGDAASALQVVAQLEQQFPANTLIRTWELPTIRAAIYLHQGKPDSAIDELEPASHYDLRFSPQFGFEPEFGLEPAYVRGEAYLKAGKGERAASEFRKLIEHPGIVGNSINGPLARLQLARAQVMMGDKAAARKSYQDFLTLWKDADPDIPIYQQAKAEYARLR